MRKPVDLEKKGPRRLITSWAEDVKELGIFRATEVGKHEV